MTHMVARHPYAGWLKLYYMPTGRRELALAKMAAALEEAGMAELAARAKEHVAFEKKARAQAIERRVQVKGLAKTMGDASAIDPIADRQLAGIEDIWSIQARSLRAGHPVAEAARRLLAAHFPDGISGIIQLVYAEQLGAMETFLERLAIPQVQADLQLTGVVPLVVELTETVGQYRQELEKPRSGVTITAEMVQSTYNEAQNRLIGLVIAILARTFDAPAQGERILAGLQEQQNQMRAAFRGRRRASDIDPATGTPIEEANDPNRLD